jgi:hypothetical protein
MKKIELILTARQLNTLVYSFTFIQKIHPKTRSEKVMKSILEKLMLKIKKKHLEVEASIHTLFTKPKKCKFTFEYYEADSLEHFLLIAENFILNDYDQNCILFIKNKLNQQLA